MTHYLLVNQGVYDHTSHSIQGDEVWCENLFRNEDDLIEHIADDSGIQAGILYAVKVDGQETSYISHDELSEMVDEFLEACEGWSEHKRSESL
jgi:hypothetical protein